MIRVTARRKGEDNHKKISWDWPPVPKHQDMLRIISPLKRWKEEVCLHCDEREEIF